MTNETVSLWQSWWEFFGEMDCRAGENALLFGIFLLAHHSKRKFPTFVIRANIAEIDYIKTQEPDFWPETISARDWIVRNEKNPDHPDHSEDSDIS